MVYSDDFSERMPAPVGVVFMDINGLKKLNTVRGHVYGDMVITHISEIMKQFFPNGRKFRLSGDEFLIVTEAISYDEFSEQLKLMEAKFTLNGESVSYTHLDVYKRQPLRSWEALSPIPGFPLCMKGLCCVKRKTWISSLR